MLYLNDFDDVKRHLKEGKKIHIEALHKFVFESNGDRQNRKRLREFSGFTFVEGDVLYEKKVKYIEENLTNADLTSISILLNLNYNTENLPKYLIKNLCQDNLLRDINKDDNPESEDESEGEQSDRGNHDAVSVVINDLQHTRSDNEYAQSVSSGNQQQITAEDNANQVQTQQRFSLNFRDVEDSVRCFDGTGKISVEVWVQEFEEMAILMGWDQLRKMIFAKKSLKGIAKLFVMGERGLTSWEKLSDALIEEFRPKLNSAQIHRMLSERKMKPNESVQEYFYNMKDIAARGRIEDKAIIQYVIEGIRDNHANKVMLYGANSIKEFKERMHNYELFTKKQTAYSDVVNKQKNDKDEKKSFANNRKDNIKPDIKCYNCGENGHKSTSCKNKHKGTKCFNCNQFGHVARDCSNKTAEDEKRNIRYVATKKDLMTKNVKINGIEFTALFDTGSKLNIMKIKIHRMLKQPKLSRSHMLLTGFGKRGNKTRPVGCFDTDIEIDEITFNLEFQVTSNDCMDVDIIIGSPICSQAEIVLNQEGVHILKNEIVDIMRIQEDDNIEIDINPMASEYGKETILKLINDYKPKKNKTTNVTMKIILTDETPIASRPRRLPLTERKIVEQQLEEWLKEGIIETSESEFSSPILLVPKKDGGKRLCIDYRRLNKVIVKDRFPLPLIEDQLDRLQDAKIFSTIDLKNGFFHVAVEEESRRYTAFVSHSGQYQFTKVPFGLSNSPAVFQRHINCIFRELTQKCIALPYVDDIIIPAQTEKQAVEYLILVLKTCEDYGLKINLKKCHFLQSKIEFLGYVIENQRISPAPTKVETMLNYPVPTNLKQVESFLGLAGYFRKFIPDFARIAKPLSDLKRTNVKFTMQDEEIKAFKMLKYLLSEKPVLKIFNERHVTELHTDASADGYGAILLQISPDDGLLHPVYYMSRKTTELERKYTSYELEILAVIEALKKFRVYLLGIPFKIITDCNAFAKTMEKRDLCTRVSRWILLLQEYDYVIEHRSGQQMRHVDALSRHTIMTIGEESLLTKIKRAQQNDENLKPIIEILMQKPNYEDYYCKAGVLYKLVNNCEKIVVPNTMQYEMIKIAHEKGHFALKKTKDLVSNDYYIPKIDEKIQSCIANCIPCLLVNKKKGKQEGELHPLTKPDVPLHTYHVDHLGPLESTSKNYKHIFAVIDAFTKFVWLYPTKSTTAGEVITKLKQQSTIFGNPAVIVSDRGTAFTADEFENYCKDEDIMHSKITTGLPRANGQVERLNSVIIAVLSKICIQEPSKWYRYVDKVQRLINSSFHRSINTTPFEILMGSKMRNKEDVQIKLILEEEMLSQFQDMRDELRGAAKLQIKKVQEENKHNYNLRRKAATAYKVGDIIAIKRTQFGGGLKLKPKFLGPYRIEKVKPNATYDVVKIGDCEGSNRTTTCAEFIKPWPDSETKSLSAWPNVGIN